MLSQSSSLGFLEISTEAIFNPSNMQFSVVLGLHFGRNASPWSVWLKIFQNRPAEVCPTPSPESLSLFPDVPILLLLEMELLHPTPPPPDPSPAPPLQVTALLSF